jgi:hypothetical protein
MVERMFGTTRMVRDPGLLDASPVTTESGG